MAKNDRDDLDRAKNGILGDINPVPAAHDNVRTKETGVTEDMEEDEAMAGGSRHGQSEHAGSRDVTEGVTGGLGTETGGTSNFRSGSGATGGDIGNRPEVRRQNLDD